MAFQTPLFTDKNPIISEIWIVTKIGITISHHDLEEGGDSKRDIVGGIFSALIEYADTFFHKKLSSITTDEIRFSIYYMKSFDLFVIAKSNANVNQGMIFKTLKRFIRDFMSVFKEDIKDIGNGNLTTLNQSNAIVDLQRGMNWIETTSISITNSA